MKTFFLIFLAGLTGAAMGGAFGWLVGNQSSEFIELLAKPYKVVDPQQVGAALGLVCGLFLGAAAMAFGLFVEAFRLWATRDKPAGETE